MAKKSNFILSDISDKYQKLIFDEIVSEIRTRLTTHNDLFENYSKEQEQEKTEREQGNEQYINRLAGFMFARIKVKKISQCLDGIVIEIFVPESKFMYITADICKCMNLAVSIINEDNLGNLIFRGVTYNRTGTLMANMKDDLLNYDKEDEKA